MATLRWAGWALLIGLAFVLLLYWNGGSCVLACRVNADCPGELKCNRRICMPVDPRGVFACSDDCSCPEGQSCERGRCFEKLLAYHPRGCRMKKVPVFFRRHE